MAASNVLSTGIPCTDPSADNYVKKVLPESNRSNLSDVINCDDIPVIDFNSTDTVETKIRRNRDACQNSGFFQVINHGISAESSDRMLKVAHQFIHLPLADSTMELIQDKLIQDGQSNFVSRVIHIPSNHILSSFNRTNLHDVAQSSSDSSHPLINLQGACGQLNGLLIDDLSGIIKNIACECDGFIQVWIYAATPARGDDYERAAAGAAASSSSVMTPGLISSMFKENDIGKTVMGYVPSALVALLMNTALFPRSALHGVVIAFLVGLVLIWNGIMLGNIFQRYGRAAEKAGVVMVFLGFFGFAASVLPLPLVWAPLLCGLLFLLPFILRVLPASHCNFLRRTNSSKKNSRRPPLLPVINN